MFRAAALVLAFAAVASAHASVGETELPPLPPSLVTPPVELHNPADVMDVWSVVFAPSESAGTQMNPAQEQNAIRSETAKIVSRLSVQRAGVGVSVLGGNWGATEVARCAFNDTIDQCVRTTRSRCAKAVLTCPPLPQVWLGVPEPGNEPGLHKRAASGGGGLRGGGSHSTTDLPVRALAALSENSEVAV